MKKLIASCLIGLMTLTGLFSGSLSEKKQETLQPAEIAETVQDTDNETLDVIDVTEENTDATKENIDDIANDNSYEDTNIDDKGDQDTTNVEAKNDKGVVSKETTQSTKKEDFKNNKKKETQNETTSNKVDKVIKVDTKEEVQSLYDELMNCDEGTVYTKVIINGKEYSNKDADGIIKDLEKKYGYNLKDYVNKENSTPVRENRPEETTPVKENPPKPTTPIEEVPQTNSSYANQVLQLVNKERAKAGLSALSTNQTLTAAANKRAVETVKSFSHTRPNGTTFSTVFDEFGINPMAGGENIAYGQRSPEEVVNAWMNSPGHRANILNSKFNKMGVGVHEVNGTIYWTQLFTN